ncbi:MAG: hypothetical protein H5T84_08910 [Thermoleophilia bacterium]|nr:hypothetical protein [Thermoleophilia bacterium]
MKRLLKILGIFALIGSLAGAVYYFLFRRRLQPQVELYFADGSMLGLPASSAEAEPFVRVAGEILAAHPVVES